MDVEARSYKKQAEIHEDALLKQKRDFELELSKIRSEAQQNVKAVKNIVKHTQNAARKITLDEELTRILIDSSLNALGWEADSEELTFVNGCRPVGGQNKAISEWPTGGGQRADYILFVGLSPVAVVEAKRENVDVAGKIQQAERYARNISIGKNMDTLWSDDRAEFSIPFVYSCNGRPFIKQLAEKSGTWFRDVRNPSNLKRPLQNFHSPDGLLDLLIRDRKEAEQKLKDEKFTYLPIRDYQKKAIQHVEAALEQNKRACLLAMATGTGKTRTIMGLMYRLLKTERFKRILFLVDRT
ncbi:MAG: DEAD/DEAH box helicase family protein, partial [Spirochaetales bacterium]|nr:DEAD/DEAH box helicase family protein [Spirochaetales bacterium]